MSERIWAVSVIAEKLNTIGYRTVQVTGGNKEEAIEAGVSRIRELNQNWAIHTPAALEISLPDNAALSALQEQNRALREVIRLVDLYAPRADETCDEPGITFSEAICRQFGIDTNILAATKQEGGE